MNLVYINSGVSSVFPSQVIALLKYYENSGEFDKIILLCGVKNKTEEKSAREQIERSKLRAIYFRIYPNYVFFNGKQKRSLCRAILSAGLKKNTVFHTRGEHMAQMATMGILKSGCSLNKVLVDVRGASLEEILEFQKVNPLVRPLKMYNAKKALREIYKFGAVSAVSSALKDYIVSHSAKLPRLYINPCLAGEKYYYDRDSRKIFRDKLGLNSNETLFIFVNGGLRAWQNDEVLSNIADKGYKMLNLSKKEITHPNVVNKFVDYSEVHNYLNASDVAIIFRDKSMVNKVSSPVKFSEYVCSGLPVIANEGVDQIVSYVERTKYGKVIRKLEEIDEKLITQLSSLSRNDISRDAKQVYGMQATASNYFKIYEILLLN